MKRLWYIAHQVGAQTHAGVQVNLKSVLAYQREFVRSGVHAVAPWYAMAAGLNDHDPEDREVSLAIGRRLVGLFGGVIAVGPKWSTGMRGEVDTALAKGLPVLDLVGLSPKDAADHLVLEISLVEPDGGSQ